MNIPVPQPVYLVGAGPGDPELLTIKAVKAIAQAELILIDDLVNPEVLAYANEHVRVTWVGKRGGCRSTAQSFINRLMVREALSGVRVLRLKGGDPLIFGRAPEEIAALQAAGLQVRIINGISSALAAAASLNVSLTDREHSHGVVILTGHPSNQDTAVQWATLARSGLSLVIYMGVKKSRAIAESLLLAGLPLSWPVAIVQSASGPHEKSVRTTLALMAQAIEQHGIGSPAVILLGPIAASGAVIAAVTDSVTESVTELYNRAAEQLLVGNDSIVTTSAGLVEASIGSAERVA
jgi:uroporphyrin-III C-methyltransferase